jgi:uncharacterized protein (DUF1501 family)
MKRRTFMQRTLPATVLPFAINGFRMHAYADHPALAGLLNAETETDRVLVLIQLTGGNDGLNMVIPLDQYAAYANARTVGTVSIALPETSILKLKPETGLHPAMTGLEALYKDGKVAVLQSVGYPNPNFSHFRATDIWLTGADYNQYLNTGWMGRYLEQEFPGFPTGYPNTAMPDPLAIQIGSVISPGLQGTAIAMGMAITNPTSFYNLVNNTTDPTPNTPAGHELSYVRIVADQTNQYAASVKNAANKATNLSTLYPTAGTNTLADQMKIVARLVAGGLKTRIYIVSLGGFDTHSNQTDGTDKTIGNHATLLGKISTAVSAFQDDIKLLGVEDRVVGMTYSEFGRRIKSNASRGTDHGAAAPQFVFGSMVQGGVYGANPTIPANPTTSDNIPMQLDFRNIYASLLKEWFTVTDGNLQSLMLTPMFKSFQLLPLIKTPPPVSAGKVADAAGIALAQNYPNPVSLGHGAGTTIPFTSNGSHVRISVFDNVGREVRTLVDGAMPAGAHSVRFIPDNISAGNYYVRMESGAFQRVLPMTVER